MKVPFHHLSARACKRTNLVVLVVAVLVTVTVAGPASAQDGSGGSIGEPELAPRFDPERRVYDNANLLSSDQDEGFEQDLARARNLGVEMLVYTRVSNEDEAASQAFADRLREEWQVETTDGADDGIVLLVTYDLTDLDNHSIVASWGDQAFPIRQLTEDGYQTILEEEMRPELEEGNFDFALMFGIRRVLNYADYSPPDPAPLSATERRLGSIATIFAAITAQAVILGYVAAGVSGDHRMTWLPSARSLAWYGIGIAAIAVLTGVLAIAGRSGPASMVALVSFVWAAFGVPLLIAYGARSNERANQVRTLGRTTIPTVRGREPKPAGASANG